MIPLIIALLIGVPVIILAIIAGLGWFRSYIEQRLINDMEAARSSGRASGLWSKDIKIHNPHDGYGPVGASYPHSNWRKMIMHQCWNEGYYSARPHERENGDWHGQA